MKSIFLLSLSFLPLAAPARATEAPRIVYDAENHRTLRDFQLFLEGPLTVGQRARMIQTAEGFTASPSGINGFTLYKFADLSDGQENFDVRAVFQVPAGVSYSNSGIYFLYTDPTRPIEGELSLEHRAHYDAALENSRHRAGMYGAGPYEADYFARELQIIAGSIPGLPADNHGAGAFYGVSPVSGDHTPAGHQRITPYDLVAGDTYEMRVEVRGLWVRTYVGAISRGEPPRLVSEFQNVTREQDPIRGGSPIAIMLQMFPLNGRDMKAPVFRHLSVTRR